MVRQNSFLRNCLICDKAASAGIEPNALPEGSIIRHFTGFDQEGQKFLFLIQVGTGRGLDEKSVFLMMTKGMDDYLRRVQSRGKIFRVGYGCRKDPAVVTALFVGDDIDFRPDRVQFGIARVYIGAGKPFFYP